MAGKGETYKYMKLSEKLANEITQWVDDYETKHHHDGDFNMDMKDRAYSLFEDVIIEIKN